MLDGQDAKSLSPFLTDRHYARVCSALCQVMQWDSVKKVCSVDG